MSMYPIRPIDLIADGTMFYSSTFLPLLIGNMKIILEETEEKIRERGHSEPGLLFFNSGCHDLGHNDSALYISHFKELFKVLKEIQNTGYYHMIYQNIAPWPHTLEHNRERHLNMFLNGATTHWVTQQMEELGIDVVNLYTLALPFEDMSECTVHFVCIKTSDGEHKGVAGREAVQQLLNYACG